MTSRRQIQDHAVIQKSILTHIPRIHKRVSNTPRHHSIKGKPMLVYRQTAAKDDKMTHFCFTRTVFLHVFHPDSSFLQLRRRSSTDLAVCMKSMQFYFILLYWSVFKQHMHSKPSIASDRLRAAKYRQIEQFIFDSSGIFVQVRPMSKN